MAIPKDVNILFSMLNMKLRDTDQDLAHILADLGYDQNEVISALKTAGFTYDEENRRFISN